MLHCVTLRRRKKLHSAFRLRSLDTYSPLLSCDFATKECFWSCQSSEATSQGRNKPLEERQFQPGAFPPVLGRMTFTLMAKIRILITESNCQAIASENGLTKGNQSRVMLFLPRFASLENLVHSFCAPQILKTVLWMTDERRAATSTAEPLVCWWSSSQIIWYWSPKIVSQHGLSWSQRSNTIRWFVSEGTNDANRLVCLLQGHRLTGYQLAFISPKSKGLNKLLERVLKGWFINTLFDHGCGFSAIKHHDSPQRNTNWVLMRSVWCHCWRSSACLLYYPHKHHRCKQQPRLPRSKNCPPTYFLC